VSLPQYQHIQAIESQFEPKYQELDPEIRQAVERFNQVPGVKTQFSCQGVTGMVEFQGITFLVVSPHERLAYITFAEFPYSIEVKLREHLTAYSAARYENKRLLSSGNNVAFRENVVRIAEQLIDDFAGARDHR